MKITVLNVSAALALFAGNCPLPGAVLAAENPIVHQVTGSGLTLSPFQFAPNFQFRTSISAWQRADGSVGGSCVVVMDVRDFLPEVIGPSTVVGEVTCLKFEGNTVYFTLRTVKATDGVSQIGDLAVGYITDGGGSHADESFSGPAQVWAPTGVTDCADHNQWILPPHIPVIEGNFVVR